MRVNFHGWDCMPIPGKRYMQGDRIAIMLQDPETGEPIATATTNIVEDDIPMEADEVFIKDYSENEGMTDALITAGIILPDPVKKVRTGHVEVWSYKLTEEAYNYLTKNV